MSLELKRGLGSERLTVDNTSGGVAFANIPKSGGAVAALIRCKTAAVCFTDDGATAPTSTVGMELEPGDTLWYTGSLTAFKAIRRDSANGTLIVNYYGHGA